jgi:hypothetical protein
MSCRSRRAGLVTLDGIEGEALVARAERLHELRARCSIIGLVRARTLAWIGAGDGQVQQGTDV